MELKAALLVFGHNQIFICNSELTLNTMYFTTHCKQICYNNITSPQRE